MFEMGVSAWNPGAAAALPEEMMARVNEVGGEDGRVDCPSAGIGSDRANVLRGHMGLGSPATGCSVWSATFRMWAFTAGALGLRVECLWVQSAEL